MHFTCYIYQSFSLLFFLEKTHLLEFKEDDNKITCVDTFDNDGIIRSIVPDGHNEQRFYTLFSTFGENGIEKTGFNLKSSSINVEGEDIPNVSKAPILTYDSDRNLHSLISKLKDPNRIYFGVDNALCVYDLEKSVVCDSRAQSSAGANLSEVDPHHNDYVVSTQLDGSILIHDLRSGKTEQTIRNAHKLRVHDVDFNPLKLYCFQTVGEDSTIKFWELRKPTLPLKVLDRLNNIPLSSKFNKNHDQLIITAFNDGSLGLYRIISVSSYPDPQSSQKEEDGLVKIYDQHENTVYSVSWSNCSSWIFASASYEGNVTVNMVPSSVKHRILY